jgi:hypothetical protein
MITASTRRAFLRWAGSLAAMIFCGGDSCAAFAGSGFNEASTDKEFEVSSRTIGQHFVGEQLTYTMSFLWFKRAGSCTVRFEPAPELGLYDVTIAGQTHGVIGTITRFRRDVLSARVEEVDGGKRFRPLVFQEDVIVGSKHRKKTTRFDYRSRQITITKERKGKVKEEVIPLPPDEVYHDPITASYNFRFGCFGPIERGRRYVIKTVPKKGLTKIQVTIASQAEELKKKRPAALRGKNAYFVYLQLDKDIIGSKSGNIEGWLSADLVPIEGRIKDVVFFGDIVGKKEGQGL